MNEIANNKDVSQCAKINGKDYKDFKRKWQLKKINFVEGREINVPDDRSGNPEDNGDAGESS
jgi:hypothetical protein